MIMLLSGGSVKNSELKLLTREPKKGESVSLSETRASGLAQGRPYLEEKTGGMTRDSAFLFGGSQCENPWLEFLS